MSDLSQIPFWVIAIVWPLLAVICFLGWIFRRASGSTLRLKGFGVELEIKDAEQTR